MFRCNALKTFYGKGRWMTGHARFRHPSKNSTEMMVNPKLALWMPCFVGLKCRLSMKPSHLGLNSDLWMFLFLLVHYQSSAVRQRPGRVHSWPRCLGVRPFSEPRYCLNSRIYPEMQCIRGDVLIDKTGHKIAFCAQNPCLCTILV